MSFCLLNLSPSLEVNSALGKPTQTVDDYRQIPTDVDPLVLYVVGHAVPDRLTAPPAPSGQRALIKDSDIATTILTQRGSKKTLVFWDCCNARSFLQSSKVTSWPGNYVHVFACQGYERTWSSGGPPRVTQFSTELSGALALYGAGGPPSWASLSSQLNAQFAGLQRPEIYTTGSLTPKDFFAVQQAYTAAV
jgi:hypothetical protein